MKLKPHMTFLTKLDVGLEDICPFLEELYPTQPLSPLLQ